MKYSLMFALLVSAPIMADTQSGYGEAKGKLESSQRRVSECRRRVDDHGRRIDEAHSKAQSMTGREGDSTEAQNQTVRTLIAEREKALKELEVAEQNLQKAISEVGRNYKLSPTGENGFYTVMEPETKELEPIVVDSPTTAPRQSYQRSTKVYSATPSYVE